MAFNMIRENATKWDRQENLPLYERIRSLVEAYGYSGRFREPVIVNIIEQYKDVYGETVIMSAIEAFCKRDMRNLDRLDSMIRGYEPLAFVKEADKPRPEHRKVKLLKDQDTPVSSDDIKRILSEGGWK